MGVLRDVPRPSYDEIVRGQLADARTGKSLDDELDSLLYSGDTWAIV
jgi:2-oxoglutarate ferredoxin oxidoreductase subunit beta